MTHNPLQQYRARRAFEQARQEARREQLAARLTGRPDHLLPFEAIRAELRQQNPYYQGLREIPLDKIVGSVGRYHEFTRHFLPLNESLSDRWIRVRTMVTRQGWTPIEVYQVGEVYFVQDGNHRCAVARQLGNTTIEAYVWQFPAEITIHPQDDLDTILIRLGESNFMAQTHLDQIQPDHDIHFTSPGRYRELLAQIADLRQKLTAIDGRHFSYPEAVAAWYELIYLPTVQIIRDSTLLRDFPGRTEADLFVWLSQHRHRLSEVYGPYHNLADLAQLLAHHYREGCLARVARLAR
ncbi:MAG: hypothetical protein AB1791_09150, partial [Chloroflexota bacterium]